MYDGYGNSNVNDLPIYLYSKTMCLEKKYYFYDIGKDSYDDLLRMINESDIIQFYFGLQCKNYILCESTFHLWIAYLGTIDKQFKKVICFNNTHITNYNLALENWIKLD